VVNLDLSAGDTPESAGTARTPNRARNPAASGVAERLECGASRRFRAEAINGPAAPVREIASAIAVRASP